MIRSSRWPRESRMGVLLSFGFGVDNQYGRTRTNLHVLEQMYYVGYFKVEYRRGLARQFGRIQSQQSWIPLTSLRIYSYKEYHGTAPVENSIFQRDSVHLLVHTNELQTLVSKRSGCSFDCGFLIVSIFLKPGLEIQNQRAWSLVLNCLNQNKRFY